MMEPNKLVQVLVAAEEASNRASTVITQGMTFAVGTLRYLVIGYNRAFTVGKKSENLGDHSRDRNVSTRPNSPACILHCAIPLGCMGNPKSRATHPPPPPSRGRSSSKSRQGRALGAEKKHDRARLGVEGRLIGTVRRCFEPRTSARSLN